jgi:hypothetical protein
MLLLPGYRRGRNPVPQRSRVAGRFELRLPTLCGHSAWHEIGVSCNVGIFRMALGLALPCRRRLGRFAGTYRETFSEIPHRPLSDGPRPLNSPTRKISNFCVATTESAA